MIDDRKSLRQLALLCSQLTQISLAFVIREETEVAGKLGCLLNRY